MDSGDARKLTPSAQDAIRRKAVKAVVEGGMSQTMAAEVFGASRDHSSLSRTRSHPSADVDDQEVFTWVLKVLSKGGLILGGRIGVDASTVEANAALKTIERRDTGES